MTKQRIAFVIVATVLLITTITLNFVPVNQAVSSVSYQHLRQILHEIDMVCTKQKIQYWIAFGTLLGSVREADIITHDDDCDLGLTTAELQKLIEAVADSSLIKITYYKPGLYRAKLKNENSKGVFVDLFEYTFDSSSKRFILCHGWEKIFPNSWFTKDEIDGISKNFPLGYYHETNPNSDRLIFHPLTLNGPANPIAHLEREYGKDWKIPQTREWVHPGFFSFWDAFGHYIRRYTTLFCVVLTYILLVVCCSS